MTDLQPAALTTAELPYCTDC